VEKVRAVAEAAVRAVAEVGWEAAATNPPTQHTRVSYKRKYCTPSGRSQLTLRLTGGLGGGGGEGGGGGLGGGLGGGGTGGGRGLGGGDCNAPTHIAQPVSVQARRLYAFFTLAVSFRVATVIEFVFTK
jgi:hypothetical protein